MVAEDPKIHRLRQKKYDWEWEAGKADREIKGTL
jgi:hypothetical protein